MLYISSESTRKSTHGTRLWSTSRPTYCYIYRPKALVNLHTTQDSGVAQGLHIAIYISSESTRKSTHGTRLWSSSRPTYCYIYRPKALGNLHTAQDSGVPQGLHIAVYIVQKHSEIYTRHSIVKLLTFFLSINAYCAPTRVSEFFHNIN